MLRPAHCVLRLLASLIHLRQSRKLSPKGDITLCFGLSLIVLSGVGDEPGAEKAAVSNASTPFHAGSTADSLDFSLT